MIRIDDESGTVFTDELALVHALHYYRHRVVSLEEGDPIRSRRRVYTTFRFAISRDDFLKFRKAFDDRNLAVDARSMYEVITEVQGLIRQFRESGQDIFYVEAA